MIVETADKERSFDTKHDFFSVVGRAAMVGGGIFAINQTDFSRSPNTPFSQRSNRLKTSLAQMVSDGSMSTASTVRKEFGHFKSKYAIGAQNIDRSVIADGVEDVISRLSGGYKGRSAGLPDELRRLHGLFNQHKGGSTISYEMHNNEVSKINFKAGNRNYPINVVSKESTTRAGNSNYASRGLYKHNRLGTQFYGEDVGQTRAYINNFERIESGELSVHQIRKAYDKVRYYDDDSSRFLNGNANPDLVDMVRKSNAEDPGLEFTGDLMSEKKRRDFLMEMAGEDRAVSSPSDIHRGILHDKDSPIHARPFQIDTPDPKKIIRDVQYRGVNGDTSYLANKKTLFMEEGFLNTLREVASEKGIHFGELANDQLLVSGDNNGSVISRLRRLSVAGDAMSKSSESILDQLAKISGRSTEEITKTLETSGLAGFEPDVQAKMRNIRLGDHRGELISKRDRVEEGYKNAINEAKRSGIDLTEIERNKASELLAINKDIEESSFFGKKADHIRDAIIKPGMEDLFIDDISYENGQFTYGLRREELLGAGDKLHSSSGEVKAIVKERVNGLSGLLEEAYTRNGGTLTPELKKMFGEINMVTAGDALKKGITDRTANSLLYAAREKAKAEGNTKVFDTLDSFHKNYSSLDDAGKKDIFAHVKELTGMDMDKYVNQNIGGLGVVKDMEAAFGQSAADMGSGGLGSFSRRHLENFQALGLDPFVQEILENRTNHDAVKAAIDFEATQGLMNDKKFKGSLKIEDLSWEDIDELFPDANAGDSKEILRRRSEHLKKLGIDGNAIIDIGKDVGGQSRVAVLNSEHYYGMIGEKVGSNLSAGTKYSDYDSSVRKVLLEAKSKYSDEKKLSIAMKNYNNAIEMTKGTLSDNFLKGKASNSVYGMVNSAPEGLNQYADALTNHYGTKSALPSVGVVSDNDFRKMYGQDKFDEIMDQVKKNGGAFSSKSVIDKTNFIKPNAFAMITREPVEGLSHIAMGVLPSSMFKGNVRDGQFSLIRGNNEKGWNIMELLFGDTDGDHLAVLSARRAESSARLEKLAFGNDDLSVAYREAQAMKGELKLKGKDKYGVDANGKPLDILDVETGKRRQAQLLQKLSEKTNIGKISKGLESGHTAARSMAVASKEIGSMRNFFNVENTLHFVAEFALKAKHQNVDDLVADKAVNLLENITGHGSAAKVSADIRKQNVLKALDEMVLGDGGHDIANRVRAGDTAADVMDALKAKGIAADASYFKHIGTADNISRTVDAVAHGQTMGSTVGDIIEFATEGIGSETFKKKLQRDKIIDTMEYAKDIGFKGGKNLLKYALAPAAAIGLLGTIAGSRGEIRADSGPQQHTDGQKRHMGGGHTQKPMLNPQVRRPKYEQVKITGESNATNFNPNEVPQNANVRMEDNRKTFDKYEIQEMVERGI